MSKKNAGKRCKEIKQVAQARCVGKFKKKNCHVKENSEKIKKKMRKENIIVKS